MLFSLVLKNTVGFQYYAVTKDGAVFHVTIRNSQPIITDQSARVERSEDPRDMDLEEFNKLVCNGEGYRGPR